MAWETYEDRIAVDNPDLFWPIPAWDPIYGDQDKIMVGDEIMQIIGRGDGNELIVLRGRPA